LVFGSYEIRLKRAPPTMPSPPIDSQSIPRHVRPKRHTFQHESTRVHSSSTFVDDTTMLWIEASAHRHGVFDEEMIHALSNPIKHYELDNMIMIIGPDFAGNLLEIGVVDSADYLVAIHAMRARKEFLG
jgi:hypothetical protein